MPTHLIVPLPLSTPEQAARSQGPMLVSSVGIVCSVTTSSGRDKLLRFASFSSTPGFFHSRGIARGRSSSCQPLSFSVLTTSHRIAKLSSVGSASAAAPFPSYGNVIDTNWPIYSETMEINIYTCETTIYNAQYREEGTRPAAPPRRLLGR